MLLYSMLLDFALADGPLFPPPESYFEECLEGSANLYYAE